MRGNGHLHCQQMRQPVVKKVSGPDVLFFLAIPPGKKLLESPPHIVVGLLDGADGAGRVLRVLPAWHPPKICGAPLRTQNVKVGRLGKEKTLKAECPQPGSLDGMDFASVLFEGVLVSRKGGTFVTWKFYFCAR